MDTSKYTKISNFEDFEAILQKNITEFCIAYGFVKSSKYIKKTKRGNYYIYHYIDGTEEIVTKKKLEKSSIGKAIETGCFYASVD